MARSSLLGTDRAARETAGRDTAALGPGDNSDSAGDLMGLPDSDDVDPNVPADEILADGADIGVDRVFTPGRGGAAASAGDSADLSVLKDAEAGNPLDDEDSDEETAAEQAAAAAAAAARPRPPPRPRRRS